MENYVCWLRENFKTRYNSRYFQIPWVFDFSIGTDKEALESQFTVIYPVIICGYNLFLVLDYEPEEASFIIFERLLEVMIESSSPARSNLDKGREVACSGFFIIDFLKGYGRLEVLPTGVNNNFLRYTRPVPLWP